MATSVPAAKTGLRTYLASWSGLRPADGVTVSSAPVAPEELADKHVILGDVTAPKERAGLAGWAETPTMTCFVRVGMVRGTDEAATATARDAAAALLALVEGALAADGSAGGTIGPPASAGVGTSTLQEGPGEDDAAGTRWASYQFTVSWTSHIT